MSLTGEGLLELESRHPVTVALGVVLLTVVIGGSLVAFRLARDLGE